MSELPIEKEEMRVDRDPLFDTGALEASLQDQADQLNHGDLAAIGDQLVRQLIREDSRAATQIIAAAREQLQAGVSPDVAFMNGFSALFGALVKKQNAGLDPLEQLFSDSSEENDSPEAA